MASVATAPTGGKKREQDRHPFAYSGNGRYLPSTIEISARAMTARTGNVGTLLCFCWLPLITPDSWLVPSIIKSFDYTPFPGRAWSRKLFSLVLKPLNWKEHLGPWSLPVFSTNYPLQMAINLLPRWASRLASLYAVGPLDSRNSYGLRWPGITISPFPFPATNHLRCTSFVCFQFIWILMKI